MEEWKSQTARFPPSHSLDDDGIIPSTPRIWGTCSEGKVSSRYEPPVRTSR
jgi:hypothetical protein